MSDEYNVDAIHAAVFDLEGYLFVSDPEIGVLLGSVDHLVTVETVFFPTKEGSRGPSRHKFTGTLLSAVSNEKATKGRFLFTDGTVIFFNKALLA